MSEHFTLTELRERGWSPMMIRKLLDPPDVLRPNPVFRSAAPMTLYETERVMLAEATESFTALRTAASHRSEAAKAVAERKRGETLTEVEKVRVAVPVLEWDVLARRAVNHRNRRDAERAWDRFDHVPEPARVESVDAPTLRRWVVNYLRHELTAYDAELDGLFGKVGRTEGSLLLQQRVYGAIAEAYPMLAEECRRQLHERRPDTGDSHV
ncbi:hypothetical protein ABZW11_30080 [Nonomuraea sp. NPDC004580]|uniref:hypothetical protein n=1 Tax=Nonomuraea sp. NPDC004580 TaxID=3154552 RepID=UPI0033BBC896